LGGSVHGRGGIVKFYLPRISAGPGGMSAAVKCGRQGDGESAVIFKKEIIQRFGGKGLEQGKKRQEGTG